MKTFTRVVGSAAFAASLLLGASAVVQAETEVSGNVALTSDYRFRGVSQTTRDPAIQGGFDVATDAGFYAGTWASTVNFGTDASMELDIYAGWAGSFNDRVSWDVAYIRFEYPSEGDVLDYNEYALSLGISDVAGGELGLGVVFSEDYLNLGNTFWYYPNVSYSYPIAENISLDASVGLNVADEQAFEAVFGDDTYLDWSVGVTASWAGLDWTLAYVDTDISSRFIDEPADATVVFTLSRSL